MSNESLNNRLSADEYNALLDEAKAAAARLRHEARQDAGRQTARWLTTAARAAWQAVREALPSARTSTRAMDGQPCPR